MVEESKLFNKTSNICDNILRPQLDSKIFQNKIQSVLSNKSSIKNLLINSSVNTTDPNVKDSKDDFKVNMKSKKRIELTNLLPNSNKQYLPLGIRINPTNNSQIFGEQVKNNISKSIIEAKLGINQV